MSYRRIPVLTLVAAVLLLLAAPATAERCPCGDLLLPYFEVEIPLSPSDSPFMKKTATFAVGNCSEEAETITIEVRSNWGVLVLSTQRTLQPHEMYTVNLRDWLLFGKLPDRQLGDTELAHVQAALSGLRSPATELYYASPVADDTATGFLLIHRSAFHNLHRVLWGDWFDIDPVEEDAAGESLVRLVNDETRELCEHHLVRFIEGAAFQGRTRWLIWTPQFGQPSANPEPNPAYTRTAVCDVYAEDGTYLGEDRLRLIATQKVRIADLGWPSEFGWAECDTAGRAFMSTNHTAGARYDLTLRAFCMERGQLPPTPPPQKPSRVKLEKSTEGEDADLPPGPMLPVDAEVSWEYVVTNEGETTLEEVLVVDDPTATIVCPATTLAPGASMTCTAHGTVLPGQFHNVATVTARGDGGARVNDTDPSHYFGVEGGLALQKYTEGEDADNPPGPLMIAGDTVHWTYVVTNVGNVPLHDVVVTDDQDVDVICPAQMLEPGESMNCTAAGTAIAGQYANLGTVTALTPDDEAVSASDPSHYYGEVEYEGNPAVSLEKLTNGEDADLPPGPELQMGDTVTWSYVVTNIGDVPLHGIVVTDEPEGAVTCPSSELAPGASMVCTATGTVGEVPYQNLGTVYAYGPEDEEVIDTDPSRYYVGEEPPPLGDEGCTPGYWKNHLGSWPPTGYATDDTVESVFPAAASYPTIVGKSLLQALDFGGGPGVDGAAEILLRAGVAALLNAAHPGVEYPRTVGQVLSEVNLRLATGERDPMLVLANSLDADNNQGCPLSGPQ